MTPKIIFVVRYGTGYNSDILQHKFSVRVTTLRQRHLLPECYAAVYLTFANPLKSVCHAVCQSTRCRHYRRSHLAVKLYRAAEIKHNSLKTGTGPVLHLSGISYTC